MNQSKELLQERADIYSTVGDSHDKQLFSGEEFLIRVHQVQQW